MSAAKNVIAAFTAIPSYAVTVTKAGAGNGTITSDVAGINSGSLSASYAQGTSVVLTAHPDGNSLFTGWSGQCSGTGTCSLSNIAGVKAVTATFAPNGKMVLAVTNQGNGSISSSPSGISTGVTSYSFDKGTNVTLVATPATGYEFVGWDGDCDGASTCVLAMTANRAVTAIYDLKLGINIPDADTVLVSNDGEVSLGFNDALPTGAATGVKATLNVNDSATHTVKSGYKWIKSVEVLAKTESDVAITTGLSAHVSIAYDASYVGKEDLLDVFYWDGAAWTKKGISGITIDKTTRTVSFDVDHFSEFVLLQAPAPTNNVVTASANSTSTTPTILPVTGSNMLIFFGNLLLAVLCFAGLVLLSRKYAFLKKLI
jgi:hypothetical protein